ncbi:MAG: RNA polymerase sigma factor [Bacteroidales bacterium]
MEFKQLIGDCVHGDERAFRVLVEQYADFAFASAFKILGREEDAKDVVQESFISAWKNIKGFHPEKNFSNWLYRIIVNHCYDRLRKRKREQFVGPDQFCLEFLADEAGNDPEKIMSNREYGELIGKLTDGLSPKQRIAFVLCDLEGCSHDEASSISGMAKASLKSNLNHARRKIGNMVVKLFDYEAGRKVRKRFEAP